MEDAGLGHFHPPRIARAEADLAIPVQLLTFMHESRRLSNHRIKAELRYRLQYPTVHEGIAAAVEARGRAPER